LTYELVNLEGVAEEERVGLGDVAVLVALVVKEVMDLVGEAIEEHMVSNTGRFPRYMFRCLVNRSTARMRFFRIYPNALNMHI
jgi:hypothetical protein